jgi:nucleoside-diphosphate-sugar epimerase
MSDLHVIVGAGPVGSATAALLGAAGHRVRVITRSGSGPDQPGVERVALDASDAGALAQATRGAVALYNAANPSQYHRWAEIWPPLAASLLHAAEASGAVLVTVSNLYGYGPVDHPMREDDPLAGTEAKGRIRAAMWADALAAHQAGRIRATEVRGSDYFGPGVLGAAMGDRVVPRVLAGKGVRVLGDPDAPHSMTYAPDVARLLVAVAADGRAWGRPWHVPTTAAITQRAFVARMAEAAGVPAPKVAPIPAVALRLAGALDKDLRELQGTRYQWERPFVLDSSATEAAFGLAPTPLDQALAETVAWWRARLEAPAGRAAA